MAKDPAERIEWLEARLEQTQHQMEAQQNVLTWMLSRFPKQDVQSFLDQWELECRGNPRLDEDAALISALNEDLPQLYAQGVFAQGRKR